MAVYRVEKNRNYTVMANHHLTDPRLSLKAVGLLSRILALPDDWSFSISGFTKICREGKDAIRAALAELEAAGYIQRRQLHDETGAFAGNEYIIHEAPQPSPGEEDADEDSAAPSSGFPTTGNPTTGNPPGPSTKDTKYVREDPPIVPPEDKPRRKRRPRKDAPKDAPDWKPERFAGFWQFYPRGEAKQAAIKAWDKLQPDDALIAKMGFALMRQMASPAWRDGFGIPYASTWLNQRRWEDEPKAAAPEPPSGEVQESKGAYRL